MAKAYSNIIAKIRPQLIPLVESYHISDNVLMSCIGNSYGDIYEQQLDLAKNSPLNDGAHNIPSYFNELIKPFIAEDPKYTNVLGKL